MDSNRTPMSGQGLTLITSMGGRPVDRSEVETWCRARVDHRSDGVAPDGDRATRFVSV